MACLNSLFLTNGSKLVLKSTIEYEYEYIEFIEYEYLRIEYLKFVLMLSYRRQKKCFSSIHREISRCE